ncbi:hypothetical protein [Tenggerimyces flavus]|uniref:Uncharacterized protein n=1 Tax=Tenggerimyces flavus TaxID=1708749 RepID=A0ABV7YHI5_9ACTN|nr:hypothetical protein [Tenggerimyces flavus]MBM7789822.1 hypothetical protein [Tenggerimyces flavus]
MNDAFSARRPSSSLTRRTLLAGGAALGLAATVASPARAATYEYTSPADFDRFLTGYEASGAIGQPTENNENGNLAWGQAYVLLGLVRMYEATHDTKYLDHLIHNVDLVLQQRDSERGVTDYRGIAGPVWRARGNYTAATATLKNAAGRPLIHVRNAQSSVNTGASVEIRAGSSPQKFTMLLTPKGGTPVTTLTDLDFDVTSSRYFFKRVYLDVYNTTTRWSVRDARPDRVFDGLPMLGRTTLQPSAYVFPVHTGQLCYPMAAFVRIIKRDPALNANPTYSAKADAYKEAVDAAIAYHEREYWTNTDGWGSYKWIKETPVPCDGSNQPLNQCNTLGAASAELFRATGDAAYRPRVVGLAKAMRENLELAGSTYRWHYWSIRAAVYNGWTATGYTAQDISSYTQTMSASRQYEDISHGAINAEFVVAAYRAGLAYTATDMTRLGATYATNVRNGATGAHLTVAGTGTAGSGYIQQVPRWMPTGAFNTAVLPHALAVTRAQALQPTQGSYVLGFAYCVWGSRGYGS